MIQVQNVKRMACKKPMGFMSNHFCRNGQLIKTHIPKLFK